MLSCTQRVTAAAAAIPRMEPAMPATSAQERVQRLWRLADCVCFDIDSTVCQDEAIDELAAFLGVGEAVANCTRAAMSGSSRFREALTLRLDIMKPSRAQVEAFRRSHPPKLTPGIQALVRTLMDRGTAVFLVSGGFRSFIEPVADILGVPRAHIYANRILYDADGEYAGFDETEPTSDSGDKTVGKPGVCALLKQQHNFKRLVMVGDGATDLEAAPPADAFIGFGGNQIREAVRAKSDWYVTDFETLRQALS